MNQVFDRLLDELWLAARRVILDEREVEVTDGAWWTLLTADILGPDERTSVYVPFKWPPIKTASDSNEHLLIPERLARITAKRNAALTAGRFYVKDHPFAGERMMSEADLDKSFKTPPAAKVSA